MFTQDSYTSYKLGLLKQQEFLREAEQERLVHLAKPKRIGHISITRRILAWLKHQVVASGKQLQARPNQSDPNQTDLCVVVGRK
jgi:hypothetical protein